VATTDLTYTTLPANSGVARPAGTTLVAAPTNDMRLPGAVPEETVLVVTNSNAGATITCTVKAGVNPPALAKGQGDLTVTIAASGAHYIGPLESGRFIQADGSLKIEASATTGTINAVRVPRTA
jgi:hypothetical protein